SDPARHPRSEVTPRFAEHHHAPAGHVFAAVVADPFNNRMNSRVADAETLACLAANERLAARRAVEGNVADYNIFLGDERGFLRGIDDHLRAGKPFAEVVVRVAFDREGHPIRRECGEALPRRTGELNLDRVFRQTDAAVLSGNLAAGDRPDGAMN